MFRCASSVEVKKSRILGRWASQWGPARSVICSWVLVFEPRAHMASSFLWRVGRRILSWSTRQTAGIVSVSFQMLLPYEASPLHVGLMGPFPELTLHLAVASGCHLHAFLQLCVLGVPRCRLTQSLCTQYSLCLQYSSLRSFHGSSFTLVRSLLKITQSRKPSLTSK